MSLSCRIARCYSNFSQTLYNKFIPHKSKFVQRTFHLVSASNGIGGSFGKDGEFREVRTSSSNDVKADLSTGTGVVFDIDGVLARGSTPIKGATEALTSLQREHIPYLILTNAGCQTEAHKADKLTKLLDIEVSAEQVVLSHSPLRDSHHLHNLNVLVVGGGYNKAALSACGFSQCCDVADISYRMEQWQSMGAEMLPIEAIILMGLPKNWEESLQVIIDTLLTNGRPMDMYATGHHHQQQLPVIACEADLVWKTEAVNARFGHGAFLLAVEGIYKKMTGRDLLYDEMIGKPALESYRYAEKILNRLARRKSERISLNNFYMIGDNVDTDIYGANTFNEYLSVQNGAHSQKTMKSILVKTGVFIGESVSEDERSLLHRDIDFQARLRRPTMICDNVLDAVNWILRQDK